MASSTPELHVVAHTHWDREWYHTAERFRQRLVALVDELLDDPPPPGESFLLDGQAVLLEDYLEVRPERAAELSTLLREGRLEAGPWYVLADELIPSGEALVRNLLAGHAAVRRLRGEPPPVLYCPDSFGHPAILPELAAGFGSDVVVLWRGYGGARWPGGDTAHWRGPSGAVVTLYHLPPDGYEFGSSLPLEPESMRQRWSRIESVMLPRATTGVALLLNGADHHARQHGQHEAVASLARAATSMSVCSSSLRGAAEAIVSAARSTELQTVDGELRDSYGYAWTLQGTLGARAAQKRGNALVERLLVRDVEPWMALAPEGSSSGPRASLHAAWRTLLRCHPHDTLCGTSVDAVARAFDERMAAAREQALGLREDALFTLLGHDREAARGATEARPVVVLRNPVARARGGVASLTLAATLASVAVGPGSAERQGAPRRLPPWRVHGMPLQILARREVVALTESPRAYPRAERVVEVDALGWVDRIGGYAVETREQRGAAGEGGRNPVQVDGLSLANGLVRVSVRDDGAVRIEDRATGRVLDDVLSLEQHREAGDLYTPAPRERLAAPTVTRVGVVHRGPLRGEIAIDVRLGARAGRCRVSIQLDADLPAVRIGVRGENRAGDHRLRLVVRTGLADAHTLADAAFHPTLREPLLLPPEQQRDEHVVPTAPLHRYVTRFSSEHGATLFSDGLAEYESIADGSVAVTLLRAVGVLSRADLPERPGHAGWPRDTPLAQSLGPYEARFALALHGADSPEIRDHIERLADDVLLPITGESSRWNLAEPQAAGGLELEGDGLAFSAALPAAREGWITLRCVNRRDVPVRGRWRIGRRVAEAVRARLDETPLAALMVQNDSIEFDANAGELVTILVR